MNVLLHVSNVILVVLHEPYDSCFAFLFEVLHEHYDNCLAFLFEVSIKQSQIWDTLPTSKMELFLIKRIFKVISCRLMILYAQYCPMSFFICLSLQVSFCSRWFHLQTSKMVLFGMITIANVVFYWVIELDAVSSYEFLIFSVIPFWVHLVTGGSTLFQVVPGSSSLFQVVPARSR